jgi:hypothetical protein
MTPTGTNNASTTATAQHAERPPATQPAAGTRLTSIDQIGNVWKWESQLKWLVPDLLAEGSVNLISSASGTGKTWLAYFLAGAVAHGSLVFGEDVKQRKVLYLDGENPAFVVKQRLYDLGIQETPELKVWGGWEVEPPGGPGHPLIIDLARKEHPLLIWDSLVEFHTGDEQSSTQTREFMRKMRHLANLGATVVILHHTGKSEKAQEYRGSSDIEAAVDMAFKLAAVGSKTELDRLTLTPFKTRLMPLPTRELRYVKRTGFELSAVLAKPGDDGPDPVEVVREIVGAAPLLNQTEIKERAREAGIAKHKAEAALKRRDVFNVERGEGNELVYSLVPLAAAEPPGPVPVDDGVPV